MEIENETMTNMLLKVDTFILICFGVLLITSFATTEHLSFASSQNGTSVASGSLRDSVLGNGTSIILVHGSWSDGSVWSKVIPILTDAGHRVIAAQLPLHSLRDDVDTVKRTIERVGGPTILVGHSYGGEVITNAGYNDSNVTGLVYLAAIAPDEGETSDDLFENLPEDVGDSMLKMFLENTATDSAGFLYFNPEKFHELFAHDIAPAEASLLAIVQKPINQSINLEISGPPAWKQLPTWYQISEHDRLIPPDIQRLYAERMNAITLSLNSSHMSPLSHPEEVSELILNATKVSITK